MTAFVLLLLVQASPDAALLAATSQGNIAAVEEALADRAPLDARDETGRTALILASAGGHDVVVRRLVDAGANVNAAGTSGWTALAHAEAGGHTVVVDLLLDSGAEWRDVPLDEDQLQTDAKKLAEGWDTDPVLRYKPPHPSYPKRGRDALISGEVVLQIEVSTDGSTEVVEVLKPLLHCTQTAKDNARKWKWKPAEKDGKPVEAVGIITVTFDIFREG